MASRLLREASECLYVASSAFSMALSMTLKTLLESLSKARCDSMSPANAVPTKRLESASRSVITLIKILYSVISQISFAMKCHYSINSGKVKAFLQKFAKKCEFLRRNSGKLLEFH